MPEKNYKVLSIHRIRLSRGHIEELLKESAASIADLDRESITDFQLTVDGDPCTDMKKLSCIVEFTVSTKG